VTRTAAWGRAGLLLAAVVVLDQLTKRLAADGIARGDSDPIFPGIELVHVRNDGIAFGAFGGGKAIVVIAVGVALVGLLVFFALNATRPWAWLSTGLLLGGALGNVVDRVRDGAVTDFLKVPYWPAFILADVAITLGVLSLIFVLDEARGR